MYFKTLLKDEGFVFIKNKNFNFIIKKGWNNQGVIKLLELTPDTLEGFPNSIKLSTVPSTTVIKVRVNHHNLYFKFFHLSKVTYKIRDTIRKTKAEKALQGAILLKKAGLNTAEVIAIAHRTGIKKTSHILLVTHEIEGISLRIYSRKYSIPQKTRHLIAHNLGKEIAIMHQNFITHGDLHPGNIIILSNKSQPSFFYLDTERVKKNHTKFNKYVLKDLSLLNHPNLGCFSKKDRLIFIRSYFENMKDDIPLNIKELIKEIHSLSSKRYTKNDKNK